MAIIDENNYTITDKERDDRRVARLHNRPNNNGSYGRAGLGPEDVKKAFDEAVDLVVQRHNAFVKDVCEQVNEHSELIGDPDDTGVGDENVYQVLRYAKQAAETVGKTLGNESDESGADTVYGQAKRAEDAADTAKATLEELNGKIDQILYGKTGVLDIRSDKWSGNNTLYEAVITIDGVGKNDVIFLYPTTVADCQAVDDYGIFADAEVSEVEDSNNRHAIKFKAYNGRPENVVSFVYFVQKISDETKEEGGAV